MPSSLKKPPANTISAKTQESSKNMDYFAEREAPKTCFSRIQRNKEISSEDNEESSFNLKELKKIANAYDYNEEGRKLTDVEKAKAIERFNQPIIEKLKRQMNKLETSIEYSDKKLIFLRNKNSITLERIGHYKAQVFHI